MLFLYSCKDTNTYNVRQCVYGRKQVFCLDRYGNAVILPGSPCLLIRKRQNAAWRSSSLFLLLSLRKKAVELYTESDMQIMRDERERESGLRECERHVCMCVYAHLMITVTICIGCLVGQRLATQTRRPSPNLKLERIFSFIFHMTFYRHRQTSNAVLDFDFLYV